MDVLTSETCWAVNWHNKASVIKLVCLYSNEFWSLHGGLAQDFILLGYDAMAMNKRTPTFRRNVVPLFSATFRPWRCGNYVFSKGWKPFAYCRGSCPRRTNTHYSVRIIGRCNLFNNSLQNTYCCLFVLLRWMYDIEVFMGSCSLRC